MTSSSDTTRDSDYVIEYVFSSKPKQFIAERDIYHVLLENGESCIFKPAREEDPDEERNEYIPQVELLSYNMFRCLQGKHIPICYALITMNGKKGLLLQDCGQRTFEYPPQDNENAKFILFLRAMCAMERCMAAGLVHHDAHFRNIIYDPVALQVRIIDIEGYTVKRPQDVWASMDVSFAQWFGYNLATTSSFWWGLTSVINALMKSPFDRVLYLLVLHYCFCLVKKKLLETFAPSQYTMFLKREKKRAR